MSMRLSLILIRLFRMIRLGLREITHCMACIFFTYADSQLSRSGDKIHNVYISFLATAAIYNGRHFTRKAPYFIPPSTIANGLESLSSRLGTLVVRAGVHDPQLAHGADSTLAVCRVKYRRRVDWCRNGDWHRNTVPPQSVIPVGGRSSRSTA